MQQPTPEWLSIKVAKGIQLLMALRLKRAPFASNAEDVYAVCEAWLVVLINHPVSWDEQLYSSRIEAAFKRLAAKTTEWPSPAEFLACLPDRQQQRLPKVVPIDDSSRQCGRETLKNILMRLKGKSSRRFN